MQVRLNVLTRKEPLFGYVEFNVLDSPREACTVCSLDLSAAPGKWRQALRTALGKGRTNLSRRPIKSTHQPINQPTYQPISSTKRFRRGSPKCRALAWVTKEIRVK